MASPSAVEPRPALAEVLHGAGVGLDRVVDAAGAQVDGRDHLPAAPVLGAPGKMGLDARHRGGEVEALRVLLEARRQRLGRQVRRAVGAVDRERQQRHG